jgi:hypothetical protein
VDQEALTQRVYAAAEAMQDEEEGHAVPSPSSVFRCRRQLWYTGKRVARSNRLAPRSIKTMEQGKLMEPFWHGVYRRAGFTVLGLVGGSRIKVGPMSGEFDGLLIDQETGEEYLLELKNMGAWSYMKTVMEGVQAAEPDYYAQVQQYMAGAGVTKAIFHAGMADASATVWLWQKIKKQPGRPPDFHIEVIPAIAVEQQRAFDRAEEVIELLQSDDLPRADYDPREGKYPCGSDETPYCGHRDLCLRGEAGLIDIAAIGRGLTRKEVALGETPRGSTA